MNEVRDPKFEQRVRESFARQQFMTLLGATLMHVAPGEADIELPFAGRLTQQHGYVHAGVLASILDSACGYAAFTLMEAGSGVLTVEFKINLLEPAVGRRFVARGRVVRGGRTLTICRGEAVAEDGGGGKVVAIVTATLMAVRGRAVTG